MRNLIKEIMQTKYKYVFVAFIIIITVFSIGALSIISLENYVSDQHVSYTEFTVVDKYVSEQGDRYYMVVSDTNETFDIRSDDVGSTIFNNLKIGQHYHFVTQKEDSNEITHIIQVYNETN